MPPAGWGAPGGRALASLALCVCCGAAVVLSADVRPPGLNVTAVYEIPLRIPLPVLPNITDSYQLDMVPMRFRGPGDNTSAELPYVAFTGRVYNYRPVAGLVRIKQGTTFRLRVCNKLSALETTLNATFDNDYGRPTFPLASDGQAFSDPNILASHLHGVYGNTGNDGTICSPPSPDGTPCYPGDNIFATMLPGECVDYQYNISPVHAPGTLWLHPHHHGSTSVQAPTASLPVVVDLNPGIGFDFLAPASCARFRPLLLSAEREVVLHMQTLTLAVDLDGAGFAQPDRTGPTDDGFISAATRSLPQDPFCCAGPTPLDDGTGMTTWSNTGTENGTGPSIATSYSTEEFYSSGADAEFTLVNGAYEPTIAMQARPSAGEVYRFRIVQASAMKWMDLSLDRSGCAWGIYARDGVLLRSFPRLTDHVALAAANRVEMFVRCEAGQYALRTGHGPLDDDPQCETSHCELLRQAVLATLNVTGRAPGFSAASAAPFGEGQCEPNFPPYLRDTRALRATTSNQNHVEYLGVMNFSNPDPASPESANCAINGLLYGQSAPLQARPAEVMGETTELTLINVEVHPFHHHIQPFQVVHLGDGNASTRAGQWQEGDYADVLLLPSTGLESAVVRWIPGPVEIIGTGFAVLHCHILPHSDEGCMIRTQFMLNQWVPSRIMDNPGAKAGVTLAALAGFLGLVVAPLIVLKRRRTAKRAARRSAMSEALVCADGGSALNAVP